MNIQNQEVPMEKVLDWLFRGLRVAAMSLMAVFSGIVITSIFFRYVLNDSLTWAEQVCRYLFIWMIMIAAPGLYRNRIDINFDMILKALPKKTQQYVTIFLDLLILSFGIFIGTQGVLFVAVMGNKILPGLNVSQWIVYISQPLFGYLLALVAVEHTLKNIRSRAGGVKK
jgi:TRAP-type C4-dicarboxylate transport system permease small subunit